MTSFFSDTFADLNGQPLDGSAFLLDFVFTDMKHVETITGMALEVVFDLSGLASIFNGQLINAFLSDENGNNIGNVGGLYVPTGSNIMTYRLVNLPVGIMAHDVHMEIRLPTDLALTITGATFSMFHDGGTEFEVGPLPVPEPGTLALFGIGLFGMGLARRKKV